MLFFIAGTATSVITAPCTGLNHGWSQDVPFSGRAGCHQQMPWETLLVLLFFSALELGFTSLATLLGFQATLGNMWPVNGSMRSLWDRTGASSSCPQSPDRYLDPAEGVPMAAAAPCESPPQQAQHILKHLLFLGADLNIDSDDSSPAPDLSEAPPFPHSCLWRVGFPAS